MFLIHIIDIGMHLIRLKMCLPNNCSNESSLETVDMYHLNI